jgi:hypothetical protein
VEKYGRAGQATDDNKIRRTRFACWITKATDTHLQYVIVFAFHGNSGYMNRPQCTIYIVRMLPVSLASHAVHRSWLVIAS